MKQLALACALGLGSLLCQAQTYEVDLSTGKNNANGTRIGLLQFDDTWRLKRPGSSNFQYPQVGTGVDNDVPLFPVRYHGIATTRTISNQCSNSTYELPIGWLSPDIYYAGDLYPYTGDQDHAIGDMKSSATGTYTYRHDFVIPAQYCKRIQSAEIFVNRLSGLSDANKIVVNGHIYDLSNHADPSVDLNAGGFVVSRLAFCGSGAGASAYFGGSYNPAEPQPYTITVDVSHLTFGANKIEVICESSGKTGFICDAKLEYVLSSQPICLDLSGTSTLLCDGASGVISIGMNDLPGNTNTNTYFIGLYDGNTLVPGTVSAPNPLSVSGAFSPYVYSVTPTPTSDYRVIVTGSPDYYLEVPIRIKLCKTVPEIGVTVSPVNEEKFTINTHPVYHDETSLQGFESKWTIEELDKSSLLPLYTISDPACWRSGHNGFQGFDAADAAAYQTAGTVTEMTCAGTPGLFAKNHLYRITRSVKTPDMEWESYSITIEPGAEPLGKRGAVSTGSKTTGAAKAGNESGISIYPNPGKGVFMVTTKGAGTMEVFDISGKRVKQVPLKENQNGQRIDLSELSKGIYIVNITTGGTTAAQKLVVE